MTRHYRWDTTLDDRRRDDPGRRAAARLTQAEVVKAMKVSQARVSRMERGDVEKMQVESIAAYVTAIGGHLRQVADFGHAAATTFIDCTDTLTA